MIVQFTRHTCVLTPETLGSAPLPDCLSEARCSRASVLDTAETSRAPSGLSHPIEAHLCTLLCRQRSRCICTRVPGSRVALSAGRPVGARRNAGSRQLRV